MRIETEYVGSIVIEVLKRRPDFIHIRRYKDFKHLKDLDLLKGEVGAIIKDNVITRYIDIRVVIQV